LIDVNDKYLFLVAEKHGASAAGWNHSANLHFDNGLAHDASLARRLYASRSELAGRARNTGARILEKENWLQISTISVRFVSFPEMDTLFTLHGIDANKLLDLTIKWLFGPGLRILSILILAWVAIRVGRVFIDRSLNLTLHDSGKNAVADIQIIKRRNTLSALFLTVLRVAVVILAALMVFRELAFEIGPILASAGVVGLALGFGAQSLVKDIITGAFIVLEGQFSVGDVVKIGDRSGVVESLGLRTTILRDLEGTAHIFPNGKIEIVSVMTREWSQLVLDVDVAYDTDLDQAAEAIQRVLNEYAQEFPSNVLGKPQVLGVESFGDNSVKIRSTLKTAPSKQWDAGRIIRRRIKGEFDRLEIAIPFQQSVAWRIPEQQKTLNSDQAS
jgi:small conductance mechanosensitive channel